MSHHRYFSLLGSKGSPLGLLFITSNGAYTGQSFHTLLSMLLVRVGLPQKQFNMHSFRITVDTSPKAALCTYPMYICKKWVISKQHLPDIYLSRHLKQTCHHLQRSLPNKAFSNGFKLAETIHITCDHLCTLLQSTVMYRIYSCCYMYSILLHMWLFDQGSCLGGIQAFLMLTFLC